MAEEEIVILEDDSSKEIHAIDSPQFQLESQGEGPTPPLQNKSSKKLSRKMLWLGAGGVGLLLLIILLLVLIFQSAKETQPSDIDPSQLAKDLQRKTPEQSFGPSRLETMLKKANMLYDQGNKSEALKLYEEIAIFNEALSHYNIGVAQMREEDFAAGLESFKKAILNHENRAISAINAAVCALELENQPLFNYYLGLAETYLPEESNSPLYSYYVGLVHYYKNLYYEALSAFSHPTSEHYKERQRYLASKVLSFLDANLPAIDTLLAHPNQYNALTLGLLNARIGEYDIAKAQLTQAMELGIEQRRATIALALVESKLGNLQNTATLLLGAQERFADLATQTYPIQTTLKTSLFDINQAQKDFKEGNFFNKEKRYDLLFYFAPYKIFNAQQTIDYIRKGSLNIEANAVGDALDYLQAGSNISRVNAAMTQALNYALDHQVYKANQLLLSMIDTYPQHAILHYNLGLTYAQLGNYSLANRHFTTSYRLNPRNYLSGAFALMSADLIGRDTELFANDIKETLESDPVLPESNPYIALIHLVENNQLSMARWLEETKEKSPFYLVFDIIISKLINNTSTYLTKAEELQKALPRDLVSNILAFHAKFGDNEIKTYAKAIQIEFRKLEVDMDAFYYGPKVVKEQYTKLLQIGGLLHHERAALIERMKKETKDVQSIVNTVAYLSIYTHHFQEAYTFYNQLIDDYKQQDSRTIFLGAVASIGAGQPANAIALLELSKRIDPANIESRYALGLLYQEVKNYEGAAIQFNAIGNSGFVSDYFSFKIEN
ncbi:tetratricopeptide repeat protein [Sulfurospirillum sp. T05]|uniref:Tetratricopeptide repeat protein n=1 Tax=Sulfurospirillum tamanense TaxID=2813362 RepID=A0ABS2WU31_9BACT|nr:tetratricopeptide repeat protein [Sulfurospirillum tamanensis]MBN2965163.1 tetratricopeptide repeat protein [Sulfurospirillum tamanensis]